VRPRHRPSFQLLTPGSRPKRLFFIGFREVRVIDLDPAYGALHLARQSIQEASTEST